MQAKPRNVIIILIFSKLSEYKQEKEHLKEQLALLNKKLTLASKPVDPLEEYKKRMMKAKANKEAKDDNYGFKTKSGLGNFNTLASSQHLKHSMTARNFR